MKSYRLIRASAVVVVLALLCSSVAEAVSCGDGYRTTLLGSCEACEDTGCKTCLLSTTMCTICADGYYMTLLGSCKPCPDARCQKCGSLTGVCISSNSTSGGLGCGDGYYTSLLGKCEACTTAHCKKCYLSPGSCSTCVSGYYLTLGGTCEPCPGRNCKQCADLSGLCTGCPAGMRYFPPNLGLIYNASKYGYCDGASSVQHAVVAALVVLSFVVGAMAV